MCPRTDSMSSHESAQKTAMRGQGKSSAVPLTDIDWSGYLEDESNVHKAKKQSSQIAKELSDLVIYVQVTCMLFKLFVLINFKYFIHQLMYLARPERASAAVV